MFIWDYIVPKDWKPQTPEEWEWFFVRKINHDDLEGIKKDDVVTYFPKIKKNLDPGKATLLEYYLEH